MSKLAELSRQIEEAKERDSQFIGSSPKNGKYSSRVDWLRTSLKRVQDAKSEQELDRAYMLAPVGSEVEALVRYKLEKLRQKFPTGGVI